VKRFVVLLVLLAGGLVAAALVIPTNAAVVNGASISQQQLNAGVHAVAGSPDYQCFINSETYINSQGSAAAPPVAGAGTGQNPGDLPTATTDFTAEYLNQQINQETVEQLAAKRGVTVSQAQLDNARTVFEGEITQVMAEVAQTAEGENPAFSCGATGKPLTGSEVLATLPSSFVDQQVQYVATQIALAVDFSGYGSSAAELLRYYQAHLPVFDTACFTVAVYSSQSDATAAKASVASGTPFATVAAATQSEGGGPQGCAVTYEVDRDLPANANLEKLALNTVSDPIAFNNSYILVEVTKRTPTAFSSVKPLVNDAVQQAGATKAQAAVAAVERRSDISVNPQYGVWVSVPGQILIPLAPATSDVPNAKANEPATATSPSTGSSASSPFSG
jgi:parvulin-like peptidyl-prolyl isomerase